MTAKEMAAEMHDSHGFMLGANLYNEKIGMFLPPVFLRYIEKQAVVEKVLDDKSGIKVGDVILTVDGEPVEQRRDFLSRFIPASTPQSVDYSTVAFGILRG